MNSSADILKRLGAEIVNEMNGQAQVWVNFEPKL